MGPTMGPTAPQGPSLPQGPTMGPTTPGAGPTLPPPKPVVGDALQAPRRCDRPGLLLTALPLALPILTAAAISQYTIDVTTISVVANTTAPVPSGTTTTVALLQRLFDPSPELDALIGTDAFIDVSWMYLLAVAAPAIVRCALVLITVVVKAFGARRTDGAVRFVELAGSETQTGKELQNVGDTIAAVKEIAALKATQELTPAESQVMAQRFAVLLGYGILCAMGVQQYAEAFPPVDHKFPIVGAYYALAPLYKPCSIPAFQVGCDGGGREALSHQPTR